SLDFFLDTRKPKQINYSKIDQPIRHMIYQLDQVPFLRTIKSRSGRLRDEIKEPKLFLEGRDPTILAADNHKFITGGYLIFEIIDIFNPKAKEFMKEIRELEKDYSFVTFTNEENQIYRLDTPCEDLTRTCEITEEDCIETKIRKQYEVKKNVAENRIQAFLEIRDRLAKLAEKYIGS
ncbi:hypothetical protein KY325_02905, partial [Candidatus Woesearchaeota archaeon]|nr:hypothetical protein [Candidatus Woesearchaeota archaeon]